jgi:peptidoglycan/xylan/chitin deacetylase (PgdA/CDA1 family)
MGSGGPRERVKRWLARMPSGRPAAGATLLIYHRVGGGSSDELDVPVDAFREQVAALSRVDVVPIDEAHRRLTGGDARPSFVLTFDDGFADLYENAWPVLRERELPFTVYLTTGYVGGQMRWEGSTSKEQGAAALTWEQLHEMVESGLCTVGNHTHTHVRPELLSEHELDRCTAEIEQHLKVTPRHFAYTWGVRVPQMEPALRDRFLSAATGQLGRNLPGCDPVRLLRVPVRRTDPLPFFEAKLHGQLLPEKVYARIVTAAKRAGVRA